MTVIWDLELDSRGVLIPKDYGFWGGWPFASALSFLDSVRILDVWMGATVL